MFYVTIQLSQLLYRHLIFEVNCYSILHQYLHYISATHPSSIKESSFTIL